MSTLARAELFLRLRRDALAAHPSRLGLDFVELREGSGERSFLLHFVPQTPPIPPGGGKHGALDALAARHFRFLAAGVPVDGLFEILDVCHAGDEPELTVPFHFVADSPLAQSLGEAPVLTLELVDVPDLDPFFCRLDFSLRLEVPPKFDCQEVCIPEPPASAPPSIDYLSRDYDSFRRLMLDHLSRRLPEWKETNPADATIATVELLADAADQLAWFQDSVATEAYLGTARRRISVRRHGRLVGYRMHEGANARLWAAFEVDGDPGTPVALEPGRGTLASFGTAVTGTGTAFVAELMVGQVITADPLGTSGSPQSRRVVAVLSDTAITVDAPFDPALAGADWSRPGAQVLTRVVTLPPGRIAPESREHDRALAASPLVFETAEPAVLWPEHNVIPLYTWGAEEFTLPAGATSATLVGRLPNLAPGQVLAFEEILGATTGLAEDADPRNRAAVRLRSVSGADDPLAGAGLPPATAGTGTITSVGTAVTGSGTAFLAELGVGHVIVAADQIRRVVELVSDTELTLDAAFATDLTAAAFTLGRLTEVAWAEEDALPAALCVATVLDDGTPLGAVAAARGNLVLADHGRTVGQNRRFLTGTVASAGTALTGTGTAFTAELLPGDEITAAGQSRQVASILSDTDLILAAAFAPELPAGTLFAASALPEVFVAAAGRFRPRLALPDLTHRQPFDPASAAELPAGAVFTASPVGAMPVLELREPAAPGLDAGLPAGLWHLRPDLLGSDRFSRDFVVEMDDDGTAVLRFGDGTLGEPPLPGTILTPVYRVGNGSVGNVGPDSLAHAVTAVTAVRAVANPLGGRGGIDPESLESVRQGAPGALHTTFPCTTEKDFVRLAESHPEVERAVASLDWTGAWQRLTLGVQRRGGQSVDLAFAAEVLDFLESRRVAGIELGVVPLRFVGLDIALTVLLAPDAVAGVIERELLDLFSNGEQPDGRKGFFHPDNLDFGHPIYLSRVVRTALTVPGVVAIDSDPTPPKPNRFRRFGEPDRGELAAGQIRLGNVELPRLDNDPAAPENGQIRFFLEGGR